MFHWYRRAVKCYVYLADVLIENTWAQNVWKSMWINQVAAPREPQEPAWKQAFRKSRWFTRGWTLQELLAPTSVEFFSKDGHRLGDKHSLEDEVHGRTGLPKIALQGGHLSQFSVTERFRWIELRQTSRDEDLAYSLLGIFNVDLPLCYGEGRVKAFERLRGAIDTMNKCIRDLHITDPRDDKERIEDAKGGLLEDSYCWVLKTPEFQQWRGDQHSRLLWVKGNPGKGKTMLLCGIINELNKSITQTALLAYFFCQATDLRINSATAVLRGLIYMLVRQQRSLASHIQKMYDYKGKALFENANAWVALSKIFNSILQDPRLHTTYLIIDALDECVSDLDQLLALIMHTLSTSHAKWIVSSRNWGSIEKYLDTAIQKFQLSLELNEASVAAAVTLYIRSKVDWLAQKNDYSCHTRDAVQCYLIANAHGTFLWVALACHGLSTIPGPMARKRLTAFPPGLDSLYKRMVDQITNSESAELCKHILAIISTVYQPITLDEMESLVHMSEVDIPSDIDGKRKVLLEIVGLCGSLLTVQSGTISFVHQSAKDYLHTNAEAVNEIFPSGIGDLHYLIFSRSLKAMTQTLQKDMYNLRLPGISINSVQVPDPNPLAPLRYPCLYWVHHFQEADRSSVFYHSDLTDSGAIYQFFQNCFLYWLEAVSLIEKVSEGILAITSLESSILSPYLHAFVRDAKRFALYNRFVIEQAPLQLYYSALIFAPEKSIVRKHFERCIPTWIERKPKGQGNWSSTLQTLEGHSSPVSSVAFSPDGKVLASGSYDSTVRLWDTETGAALQTLEGHSNTVSSVAFSPDGKVLASGSWDKTIRLWDTETGAALQTLEDHSTEVNSVDFWDDVTGVAPQSLQDTLFLLAKSVDVNVKGDWVTINGQETLWLPPDYRPSHMAVYDAIIAIGCPSGRIVFLYFYSS